jgi:NhaA family Na+:H+ antiporter
MKHQAVSHHRAAIGVPRNARRSGGRVYRFVMDRFLLLPLGAVIALVWANVAGESYFRFSHALAFPVNEIGMAFFLALIAQEVVEALIPGGALHTWRRWGMPIAAAAGGLVATATVYLAYVYGAHEQVLAQAWPVAGAIDIAAGYYLLKLVWRRSGALAFYLLLAIAIDLVGLVVLAFWSPFTPGRLWGAGLLVAAVALAAAFRRAKVRGFWPYLFLCGAMSWFGFYIADVHPALALVPIVPFLPHEPRPLDLFAERPDDDAVHHAEHEWHELVQLVMFLFGLFNVGVVLQGYDTGSWAVVTAALVGRPLGILAGIGLGLMAGLQLPRRLGWRELVVVALATSSGFTFAVFFATGLLPVGAVLTQIKFGALLTGLGAVLALGAAWLLRVGAFGARSVRTPRTSEVPWRIV